MFLVCSTKHTHNMDFRNFKRYVLFSVTCWYISYADKPISLSINKFLKSFIVARLFGLSCFPPRKKKQKIGLGLFLLHTQHEHIYHQRK
jgi:hypothetical protein